MHPLQLKKFFIAGSCAALAICVASYANPASAETAYDGIYMSALGGIAFTSDFSTTIAGIGSGRVRYSTPFEGSTPFVAGGAIGYKRGPYRYEGEVAYIRSNYKNFQPSTGTVTPSAFSGRTEVITGLANIYYDFDMSGDSNHIYLGAGGGYARVEDRVSTSTVSINNQKTSSFAVQAIIGYAYNFNASVSAGIDYRYFTTIKKIDFNNERYQSHLLNISVSYYIG